MTPLALLAAGAVLLAVSVALGVRDGERRACEFSSAIGGCDLCADYDEGVRRG